MNEDKYDCTFKGYKPDLISFLENPSPSPKEYYAEGAYQPLRACELYAATRMIEGIEDAVPLLHSPSGCAYFMKMFLNKHKLDYQCPSTALDQNDIIFGSEDKLKNAIIEIDKQFKPALIAVIAGCVPLIIGDNLDNVIEEVRNEIDAKYLIKVEAGGFKSHSQIKGYSKALIEIINNVVQPPGKEVKNTVNLFGEMYIDKPGLKKMFDAFGININLVFTAGSNIAQLERTAEANLNICRCETMATDAVKHLEKLYGIPYYSGPMPYNLYSVNILMRYIGDLFNVREGVEDYIREETKKITPIVDKLKKKLAGKKAGIVGGPGRSITAIYLIKELDMELTFVNTYFGHDVFYKHLLDALETTGFNPEMWVDADVNEYREMIVKKGCEIVVGDCIDFRFFEENNIMGIPYVPGPPGNLQTSIDMTGFEGHNLRLQQLLHRINTNTLVSDNNMSCAFRMMAKSPGACHSAK